MMNVTMTSFGATTTTQQALHYGEAISATVAVDTAKVLRLPAL